jgi:hypothetical protein
MAEYIPIGFIKNIYNAFGLSQEISRDIYDITKDDNLQKSVWNYAMARANGESDSDSIFDSVINKFRWELRNKLSITEISGLTDTELFMYIMNVHTASTWRENKISYKVDKELLRQFYEMDLPKSIIVDYVVKQPSDIYYLDISEYGDKILKDSHGIFISTHYDERNIFVIRLTIIAPQENCEDVYIMHIGIPLDNSKELILDENTFEGYIDEKVNAKYLYRLIMNFMLYLHASNRDVEISERTRSNHSRPKTATVKDKFRELKEFEVGVKYGSEIRKNKVRLKYIGDKPETDSSDKRKITSHYRSAHWHRYWVGSGDNKTLELKWVEGVFVKGSLESNDVTIHRVRK